MSWQAPETIVTSINAPVEKRSVAAYLNSYIVEVSMMYCPQSPGKPKKYEKKMWQDGEDFCFRQTPDGWEEVPYRVTGTYCLWWNYTGYLKNEGRYFRGPESLSGGAGRSGLLISDTFNSGYHWRATYLSQSKSSTTNNNYKSSCVSCEKMPGAYKDEADLDFQTHSPIWVLDKPKAPEDVKLCAGYSDGRVSSYYPSDALKVSVIRKEAENGSGIPKLYDGYGEFGEYYLPRNALR